MNPATPRRPPGEGAVMTQNLKPLSENPVAVGILHARGGSRRIPLKNIRPLAGRPLIQWMVKAALESRRLSRVIVSTDHDEIARLALEAGAEVPFRRPAHLAEDVPSEDVTKHAVEFLEAETGTIIDIPVTLQPTTPFCLGRHIDACVDALIEKNAPACITVKEISERPEWMFSLGPDGSMESFMRHVISGEMGVTQSLPKLYIPNGAAYAVRRDVLFEQNCLIPPGTHGVIVSRERSVDIDEPVDFTLAEAVAANLTDQD